DLGTAAARASILVGWHALHSERSGDFRRRWRRLDGRGCGDWQAALDVPDEPDLEGLADDLHVRRQAIHRRGGGGEHYCVWGSVIPGVPAPIRAETRRTELTQRVDLSDSLREIGVLSALRARPSTSLREILCASTRFDA